MRFRLYPTLAQEALLLEACGHARHVWNLGLEQRLMWRRDKGPTPGFNAQSAQLTEARKEAERLLRLQRRLARARQGSNRRGRVKAQIARVKAREGDRRADWVEKTSTDLARRFDVIRVENLNVKAMTRSARGTVDKPGRNVRQKAALNRGILKAGWSQLVTRKEDKAPGRVEKVNPAYTSQTCNACKHIAAESRKSQAVFECVACGHQGNADVNAACNIAG